MNVLLIGKNLKLTLNNKKTHMGKVVVKHVGATICQGDCKFVGWADEKVIRYRLCDLLLVLVSIVGCLVTGILRTTKIIRKLSIL